MDVLNLTVESIEEHNYTLYSGKSVEELAEIRKNVAKNQDGRVLLAKATLMLNKPINQGLHATLKKNAPKFLEFLPVNEVATTHKFLNSEGKIKENTIYTYYPVRDMGTEYVGSDVTEEQAVEFVDVEAEDANLSPAEIIRKYAVAENLAALKNAVQANHLNELELNFRRAKVSIAMKQIKLATLDSLMVRIKTEKTRDFMKSSAGWLKAGGYEALFVRK